MKQLEILVFDVQHTVKNELAPLHMFFFVFFSFFFFFAFVYVTFRSTNIKILELNKLFNTKKCSLAILQYCKNYTNS